MVKKLGKGCHQKFLVVVGEKMYLSEVTEGRSRIKLQPDFPLKSTPENGKMVVQ